MLSHIHIKNLGIIEETDVEFFEGLNVITGETGAGKTLVINAINLILGNKSSKEFIRSGEDKANVEAGFILEPNVISDLRELEIECDDELVISREISINGRSISKVNGKLVSTNELKEIGNLLIDLHGQHDNQSLLDSKKHIEFLDKLAFSDNKEVINEYFELYKARKELIRKESEINNNSSNNLDFIKFQIDEIEEADLKTGEDDELEEKRKLLANSQKIITNLSSSYELLYGSTNSILENLQKTVNQIESISNYKEEYKDFLNHLHNSYYEIEEVTNEIRNEAENTEIDSEKLNNIEKRLDKIFKIKRKYGDTIEKIIENKIQMEKQYFEATNAEELLKKIKSDRKDIENKMHDVAEKISKIRKEKAKELEKELIEILEELEMSKVRINIAVNFDKNSSFTNKGLDEVEILFGANMGEELKQLSKIASGGEMSRVMLALKTVLNDADMVSSMIFDEIDTGISGKAGFAVANKLKNLSKNKQIICVTHLAAIAAKGDNNLYISKEIVGSKTITSIKKLVNEEKIIEIARITSGGNITDTALAHAKEMINY